MTRRPAVLLSGALLLLMTAGGPAVTPAAEAVPPPTHTLSVTGHTMYPAFDPGVERYAVPTTTATGGTLEVLATTSDTSETVQVDGRVAPQGRATLTGLVEGDEVSVVFSGAGADEVHSLVYLPAGFPRLTETVPAAPSAAAGHVLLNLSTYAGDGSRSFEAALDRHGVPAYVRSFAGGSSVGDLKPGGAPGHFTSFRGPTPTPGRTGGRLVELDQQFREVRSFETTGLVHTDSHDSVLRPDGSRILVAYEPNAVTHRTDAVIQEIDAAGNEVYTWNSAEHLDPDTETTTTPGDADYAHLNSIELMADGDVLASFRHLSAVYKIAWHARAGVARGDVVWRLGGRHSDFDFMHDPYPGGPCAQHTASELPNGNILVFDNGSVALGADPAHCVDPADPTGPTIARPQTRVTEYALDTATHQADLVWSYQPAGKFTYFAGSARRLAGGHTLIGWAADRAVTATEVDASGAKVWELKNDDSYMAYRVALADVPDAVDPVVRVAAPAVGASYAFGQAVTPSFTCADRGGSSLHTCTGARTPLDTRTPGRHTYRVSAVDGAGNTTAVTRSYTVAAAPYSRPDLLVRNGGSWVGNNVYGSTARQQLTRSVRRGSTTTSWVRVQNEGNRADRVVLRGTGGTADFRVRYFLGRAEVTSRVRAGTSRVPLAPHRSADVRVVITRLRPATAGDHVRVVVLAASVLDARRRDAVAQTVRAR